MKIMVELEWIFEMRRGCMMTRRILLFLLLLLCTLSLFPESAMANEQKTGNDITYHLSEDGTLTISGTGEITYIKDSELKRQYGIRRKDVKKIVISDGITSIGEDGCSDYTKAQEIRFPNSVKRIEEGAFYGCLKLTKINLPKELESIGDVAFGECIKLKTITIPQKIKRISHGTFTSCTGLKKVVFPDKLVRVEDGAFSDCRSLEVLIIPDAVTKIGYEAIAGCYNLKKVVLPKCLKKIGPRNFKDCPRLKTVVNRSDKSWKLDGANGARTWECGGQKITKVPARKTAKAIPKTYKIRYELNGGTVDRAFQKTYQYGIGLKAKEIPTPTRKGYKFVGWSLGLFYNVDYIDKLSWGNQTYHAIWMKSKAVALGKGKVKILADVFPEKEVDTLYIRYSEYKDMSHSKVIRLLSSEKESILVGLKKGKRYYFQFATVYVDLDASADGADWKFKQSVMVK